MPPRERVQIFPQFDEGWSNHSELPRHVPGDGLLSHYNSILRIRLAPDSQRPDRRYGKGANITSDHWKIGGFLAQSQPTSELFDSSRALLSRDLVSLSRCSCEPRRKFRDHAGSLHPANHHVSEE